MNTTANLLATLRGQGFTLAVEGDRIRVAPADRLTAELRAAIQTHRGELLDALEMPADPVGTPTPPRIAGEPKLPEPSTAAAEFADRAPIHLPADAVIVIADADGYTDRQMRGEPYMWTWIDGPTWFYVKDYPLPAS